MRRLPPEALGQHYLEDEDGMAETWQHPSGVDIRRLEHAASRQARALAQLRQAQDPAMRLSRARRHQLLVEALAHLVVAQRQLEGARRQAMEHPELRALLETHLHRLAATVTR